MTEGRDSAGERRIVPALAALTAGPAAWAAQLMFGYGLSSLACFPHDVPFMRSPPPGWTGEPVLLLAVNLVCLAASLVAAAAAFRLWRRRGPAHLRFLALCGVFGGIGFACAIAFDTVPILGTPPCWSIAP